MFTYRFTEGISRLEEIVLFWSESTRLGHGVTKKDMKKRFPNITIPRQESFPSSGIFTITKDWRDCVFTARPMNCLPVKWQIIIALKGRIPLREISFYFDLLEDGESQSLDEIIEGYRIEKRTLLRLLDRMWEYKIIKRYKGAKGTKYTPVSVEDLPYDEAIPSLPKINNLLVERKGTRNGKNQKLVGNFADPFHFLAMTRDFVKLDKGEELDGLS